MTNIAHTVAGHRCVDGEEQGIETGLCCAFNQPVGDFALAHHVQLEPVTSRGVGGLHVFNRGGAQRRQTERNARSTGRTCTRDFAFGLHKTCEPRRSDAKWQGGWPA